VLSKVEVKFEAKTQIVVSPRGLSNESIGIGHGRQRELLTLMRSTVSRTIEVVDDVTLQEAFAPMADSHPDQVVGTQIVAIPAEMERFLEERLLLTTGTTHR
jgi:hypothetical protein